MRLLLKKARPKKPPRDERGKRTWQNVLDRSREKNSAVWRKIIWGRDYIFDKRVG